MYDKPKFIVGQVVTFAKWDMVFIPNPILKVASVFQNRVTGRTRYELAFLDGGLAGSAREEEIVPVEVTLDA
jgi:hypothetical protein